MVLPSLSYSSLNDPLGTNGTVAFGINDSGQIVGYYVDSNGVMHGYLYSNGTYTTVTDPSARTDAGFGGYGTYVHGINGSGQIVGTYVDGTGSVHGFLYSGGTNGTYTTLDDPSADKGSGIGTVAFGINGSGQIVGYYIRDGSWKDFLYSGGTNGTYTTLPDDPSAYTGSGYGAAPRAINDSGQIVGYYIDSKGNTQGFLYSNGTYTTLAVPGASGTFTVAEGINDAGQIVGHYFDSSGVEHGFLYSGGTNGTYTTLDDPSTTPGTAAVGISNIAGTAAAGINDLGQIVGYYHGLSGAYGFLASLSSPSPAAVAVSINNTDVNVANSTATVTFAFSEAPTSFTLADTSAVGGTLSNLQQTDATHYTATFTGGANTDIANASVSVTTGSYQDLTGNAGSGGSTATFTVDTVTPTVTLSIDNTFVNQAHTTGTVTFTFSEAPTPFTLADTSAVGGMLTNLQQTDATHYTATFTGAAQTRVTNASVSVAAGSWQENNSNPGGGGSTALFEVNTLTTPQPPTITVSNDPTAARGQVISLSTLVAISDRFDLGFQKLELWDSQGTTLGGQFVVKGAPETGGHEIDVSPTDVPNTVFDVGTLGGTDTLWARLLQGDDTLTGWQQFTVTAPIDRPPVVTVANKTAAHGQSFSASTLFTSSDPDGDAIAQYDFWDTGAGGGYFVLNNQPLGIDQDNYVSASQLPQTTYQSGSGADTLWVRFSDGALWSAWSLGFTVTAPIDTGPVVVLVSTNISATHDQSFAVSSLFTASDPFGDAITEYDFWDTGTGGGHFLLNNQALGANQDNYVPAAQLAQTAYQSGSGADTLWVRVSDGSEWSPWSQSFMVTAPFDPGPLATPLRTTVGAAHNQSFAASNLFTANDPFGDAITAYDFWNAGAGGGRFIVNGQPLGTNQDNYVSAAQLAQITYHSGSGADTLWVRVSDGSEWSPWSQSVTVTAPVDTGPVVNSVTSILTTAGETFAASSLFTASDPFGDAIEQYDFWDTGAGGGHFAINGRPLGANQDNIVSASQLGQTNYVAGSGTDTLWVRMSEGGQWSAWSPAFTVSDPTTIGASETLELSSAYSGQLFFAAETGTLKLDNSASFAGTVAGMTGQDAINFTDIDPTKIHTPSYSGNAFGGTLSVSDGSHAANIALLGNYLASTFVTSSDGLGGTAVTSLPAATAEQSAVLGQPHA